EVEVWRPVGNIDPDAAVEYERDGCTEAVFFHLESAVWVQLDIGCPKIYLHRIRRLHHKLILQRGIFAGRISRADMHVAEVGQGCLADRHLDLAVKSAFCECILGHLHFDGIERKGPAAEIPVGDVDEVRPEDVRADTLAVDDKVLRFESGALGALIECFEVRWEEHLHIRDIETFEIRAAESGIILRKVEAGRVAFAGVIVEYRIGHETKSFYTDDLEPRERDRCDPIIPFMELKPEGGHHGAVQGFTGGIFPDDGALGKTDPGMRHNGAQAVTGPADIGAHG